MDKLTESTISVEEILALRKLGNKLLKCKTIKKVLEILFEEIDKRIHPQVCSVFLFLKDSYIEGIGRYGIDKDGKQIENDWLPDEKYKPGESFSGRAAKPSKPSSIYGESFICIDIEKNFLFENTQGSSKPFLKYGKQYQEKLGFLQSGISVPLNGSHRTFGTIEVLNKKNSQGKPDPQIRLDKKDLCWLTVVGAHLSAAISRLRKAREDKIITYLSHEIVKANSEDSTRKKTTVYQSIANLLVSHKLMPYKVCIIRLLEEDRLLVAGNKCSPGITIKNNSARTIDDGIVGKVYRTQKYKDIKISKENLNQFYSSKWIEENKLKSFLCFPCLIQGKVVGTITLFIGYQYELDQSGVDFLETISSLIATYRVGVKRFNENKDVVFVPLSVSSNVDKNQLIKLAKKDYADVFENYQQAIQSIKNKYINQIKAKNKEIELYKNELQSLRVIMHKLTMQPIVIKSIEENNNLKNE